MDFPAFFANAPTVTLRDPLMPFLGASADGVVTYCYADAVKLAGHSCPTVAGAWLMVRRGLTQLYGTDTPERGGIDVFLRDSRDTGTTGVIASIATLLTGAAPETGFGGIGPHARFRRRGLMQFDTPIPGLMALRRRDTGAAVAVDLDVSGIAVDARMGPLFGRAIAGTATPEEEAQFGALWQQRVEAMLIEHADDPALTPMAEWRAAA